MGITSLSITVTNPTNQKKATKLDFIIDSGAIYSVVPSSVLAKLGIKPDQEREFILANGQRIKRKLGIARFLYEKRSGGASVVFGQKDDTTLLGATTLEAMGFALDPFKRDLLPLPMILG